MLARTFRCVLQRSCALRSAGHLPGVADSSWAQTHRRSLAAIAEDVQCGKLNSGRNKHWNQSGARKLSTHIAAQNTQRQRLTTLAQASQAESDSDCEEDKLSQEVVLIEDSIGFVGAGQMGEALIRGFVSSGVSTADRISASVRSAERKKAMGALGVLTVANALEGGAADIAKSDIIVLGVKPMYIKSVLKALAPHVTPEHLIISIAAGVRIASIEELLPAASKVVRVMPNMPCLIGQAASAYVLGSHATSEDNDKVFALMSSVGLALQVEEHMIDAVTGLSGSGPAYVFMMLEAMADGAVAAGLPRDKALALAAQTVIGAARMVFESSGDGSLTHPGVLKDRVASPGGTTIAAIAELETSGMRGAFIRAVKTAAQRSEELSRSS